jgi:hypothetical protein
MVADGTDIEALAVEAAEFHTIRGSMSNWGCSIGTQCYSAR